MTVGAGEGRSRGRGETAGRGAAIWREEEEGTTTAPGGPVRGWRGRASDARDDGRDQGGPRLANPPLRPSKHPDVTIHAPWTGADIASRINEVVFFCEVDAGGRAVWLKWSELHRNRIQVGFTICRVKCFSVWMSVSGVCVGPGRGPHRSRRGTFHSRPPGAGHLAVSSAVPALKHCTALRSRCLVAARRCCRLRCTPPPR